MIGHAIDYSIDGSISLTNHSARSTNRCSLVRRFEDSKDPAAGASRVDVTCLRSSCSSGSCASLTLFMDRARPARYLRPGYEDEESGVLSPLRTSTRGWLGLIVRKSSSSLVPYFIFSLPPSLPPFPLSITFIVRYLFRKGVSR